MILYHGTSERNLASILVNGILPRQGSSNWSKFPSIPGHVYLTNTYPFYFGISATSDCLKERVVVFEVDTASLNEAAFYPDEDYISQDMERRIGRHRTNLRDLHNKAVRNLELHRDRWRESLEGLGTCSHRGPIPTSSIRRYCALDCSKSSICVPLYLEAKVNIHGHELRGGWQAEMTAGMFDVWEGYDRNGIEVVELSRAA